jgi:hypothetical protein
MGTHHGLFATLITPEHLEQAVARTVRGKRRRPDVAWFLFERDRHVSRLLAQLAAGTWQPGRFTRLFVHDPKPRVIARACVADRVVHTAVADLCAPIFLRSACDSDFACRPGKGTHRALLTLLAAMRRYRFALHLDIAAYFPSIDTELLRSLLAARIADADFLAVVDRILHAGRGFFDAPVVRRFARLLPDWPAKGRGLPMGAVTSQLFAAHVYLLAFDHFVKRVLHVRSYVRYVDDMFLFGERRVDLRNWRKVIQHWLDRERGLRLKHPHARILSCAGHMDALGWRIRRDGMEPLPKTWKRMRRRVQAFVRDGATTRAAFRRSMESSLGTAFLF